MACCSDIAQCQSSMPAGTVRLAAMAPAIPVGATRLGDLPATQELTIDVVLQPSNPVALAARTCTVAYDLWDEVYRLSISGPDGDRNSAALNIDGVFRQCLEARRLPVADRSLMVKGQAYFLGVRPK